MSMLDTESRLSSHFAAVRRQAWGRMFGTAIRKVRETRGRSLEDTAQLAGMETSEWAAIEAGYVPLDMAMLRPMAAAMEISYDKIALLAVFCRGAWEE